MSLCKICVGATLRVQMSLDYVAGRSLRKNETVGRGVHWSENNSALRVSPDFWVSVVAAEVPDCFWRYPAVSAHSRARSAVKTAVRLRFRIGARAEHHEGWFV